LSMDPSEKGRHPQGGRKARPSERDQGLYKNCSSSVGGGEGFALEKEKLRQVDPPKKEILRLKGRKRNCRRKKKGDW